MAQVSYNLRVMRRDRRSMTALEVAAVLLYFEDHREAPAGYRVEAINWSRRNKSGRVTTRSPANRQEAEDAMTEGFWYTLRGRLDTLRVGLVKDA